MKPKHGKCLTCMYKWHGEVDIPCNECAIIKGSGCGFGIRYREEKQENDMVHKPKHYQIYPDMEVIDVIKKTLTLEEFVGYCKGNSIKYRLRAGKKDDALQDIAKAETYEEFLNGR